MLRISLFIIVLLILIPNFVFGNQVMLSHAHVEHNYVTALGYGTYDETKNYSFAQKQLLALRAAKMDALRNLSEEVYGTTISGNTTVRDMVVRDDAYRLKINNLIKRARLIKVTPLEDGIYEAEMRLDLPQLVMDCYAPIDCQPVNMNKAQSPLLRDNVTTDNQAKLTETKELRPKNDQLPLQDARSPVYESDIKAAEIAASMATLPEIPTAEVAPPQMDAETDKASTVSDMDADWLARQNTQAYTLQLFSAEDKNAVEQFVERHGMRDNARIIQASDNGKVSFKLLYGAFNDKEQAWSAQFDLPLEYLERNNVWIRRFDGLIK